MKDILVFIPTWNGTRLKDTLDTLDRSSVALDIEVFPNKKYDWALARTWNYALESYGDIYRTIIIANDDVLFRENTCEWLDRALHHPPPLEEHKIPPLVVTAYDINAHGDAGPVWFSGLQDLAGWFCFATSKQLTEKIGWFDEHFYPAYFEDADMEHRIRCGGYETYIHMPVDHIGGQTTKNDKDRETAVNQVYFKNYQLYYRMWNGGPLGDEGFREKFNGRIKWVEKLHTQEENEISLNSFGG